MPKYQVSYYEKRTTIVSADSPEQASERVLRMSIHDGDSQPDAKTRTVEGVVFASDAVEQHGRAALLDAFGHDGHGFDVRTAEVHAPFVRLHPDGEEYSEVMMYFGLGKAQNGWTKHYDDEDRRRNKLVSEPVVAVEGNGQRILVAYHDGSDTEVFPYVQSDKTWLENGRAAEPSECEPSDDAETNVGSMAYATFEGLSAREVLALAEAPTAGE